MPLKIGDSSSLANPTTIGSLALSLWSYLVFDNWRKRRALTSIEAYPYHSTSLQSTNLMKSGDCDCLLCGSTMSQCTLLLAKTFFICGRAADWQRLPAWCCVEVMMSARVKADKLLRLIQNDMRGMHRKRSQVRITILGVALWPKTRSEASLA